MTPNKLSVVLATHNEEANLERCLQAVKDLADEIIIADEDSSDRTSAIAKSFKAKVITVKHQDNFHITKNIAIDAAKGDWILQLDADEVVSPELAKEIKQTLNTNPEVNGYWVNRRNWFLDRFLTKGGQYPDPTLRFYRRGNGRLPAKDVHEQARVEGEVGQFKNDLLHYRDISFEKYISGFNRYSSFVALQMAQRKESLNILGLFNFLLVKPFLTWFMIYFRHLGLVDGFPGFIFALFSGLIHPVAYIKYWQSTKHS